MHYIKLPLRHIFQNINVTSKYLDLFSGPIEKKSSGKVLKWGVAKFKPIKNQSFPYTVEFAYNGTSRGFQKSADIDELTLLLNCRKSS